MVVQALRHATPEQRKILENHYGRDNPADVARIKKLYGELNITKIFKDYEEESYKQLVAQINEVRSLPKEVFMDLLGKIYKRNL